MKLAEALITRGNIQSSIDELKRRLNANAIVQEGEKCAEEPCELLEELNRLIKELEGLITAINLTNAQVEKDGVTLTQMLAQRDCLKMQLAAERDFLAQASSVGFRARGAEIRMTPSVPVKDMQKEVDARAAQLRRLEMSIQELNWLSELR